MCKEGKLTAYMEQGKYSKEWLITRDSVTEMLNQLKQMNKLNKQNKIKNEQDLNGNMNNHTYERILEDYRNSIFKLGLITHELENKNKMLTDGQSAMNKLNTSLRRWKLAGIVAYAVAGIMGIATAGMIYFYNLVGKINF